MVTERFRSPLETLVRHDVCCVDTTYMLGRLLVMPIPPLEETGYLPGGDHEATLDEVEQMFGSSGFKRREIMGNLRDVMLELWALGVDTVWLDGSFISSKRRPGDVDVVYVPPAGADTTTWGRLAATGDARRRLEDYYGIHLWEYPSYGRHGGPLSRTQTIKEFFETDDDDVPKGHILVRRPT